MKQLTRKTKGMMEAERRNGKSIEELLIKKYIYECKSAEQVGKEIGVSHVSVNKWLILMGIKRRINADELMRLCKERKEKECLK